MSSYEATVLWQRGEDETFTDNRYSRAHRWRFDGGLEVPASSSPQVVPLPLSNAANVDPEEAFVAALSSCHMLFFLSFAARERCVVDRYHDEAVGIMAPNDEGRTAMTEVTLRPAVTFSGEHQPGPAQVDAWHHEAHEACFIANSVRTRIRVEPR